MSFRQNSANVRCLAPEQVVHLQYYTNSLLEDDLELSSPSVVLGPHHDPYHVEISDAALAPQKTNLKKNRRKKSMSEPNTKLPVLSSEEHYYVDSWASELDQLVLDFCCALVDRQYSDAALTANASAQTLEPCPSRTRRRRQKQQLHHSPR